MHAYYANNVDPTEKELKKIGKAPIPNIPFDTAPPAHKVKTISDTVKRPFGIAVHQNGNILVVEYGNHWITMYDPEGNKVGRIGSVRGTEDGLFTCPHKVSVTPDGHVLVTDEHRLQKLTLDGHCLLSMKGEFSLRLMYPYGAAAHPTTKQVYVCDKENHRIQVLNPDFTYANLIKGYHDRMLYCPYDLDFDSKGDLYVTNWHDHSIDVFSPDGRFHYRKFGGEKLLREPSGITIDRPNKVVYVSSNGSSSLQAFTTSGRFIKEIGRGGWREGEFHGPRGIVLDKSGNLYVSDNGNNRVVALYK